MTCGPTMKNRVLQKWALIFVSASLLSALVSHSLWVSSQVVPVVYKVEESSRDNPSSLGPFVSRRSNITITVMVDTRPGWRDWGFSFLESEQLQLFGRHNYNMEWFQFSNDPQRIQKLSNAESSHACLLVANPKGLELIRSEHAPRCKTWIINDEYCKQQGDIRHYFKESSSNELFIPLGPRYDFDQAFRDRHAGINTLEIQRNLPLKVIPTSERRYLFNAIFSKSTSPSRNDLKKILLNSPKFSDNSTKDQYVIQIPWKWRRKMHPVFHVNSSRYVDILSQSKFTLSPIGHNPECFRWYESIWMGSIPIMAIADQEYQSHKCQNALKPLLESALKHAGGVSASLIREAADDPAAHLQLLQEKLPFVVLNNWTLLESILENVTIAGPKALDARQQRLQQWYCQFMRERVWKLEDHLLENS